MRYVERYITHRTTFQILTHLRTWFYAAIEPLAPARLWQYRSGDLLTRIMADMETLENFYIRAIVPPLAAAGNSRCLHHFRRIKHLAGRGAPVFLLLTGVVLPLLTGWFSHRPSGEMIAVRADLNAALVDEVQGIADVLAFGQTATFHGRTQQLTHALNDVQERLALVRGRGNGLAVLFTGLAGLTVLWLGIPLVTGGDGGCLSGAAAADGRRCL